MSTTGNNDSSGRPLRLQMGVIKDLVLLACVGIRPVLVHGGGPEINTWLNKLDIEAEFKNGLRVTDGVPPSATPRARARPSHLSFFSVRAYSTCCCCWLSELFHFPHQHSSARSEIVCEAPG